MIYTVKRNPDGTLTENCTVNIGVKIGSFDCTANCQHNHNTTKEIVLSGFEIKEVKCDKVNELPNQKNQLEINI